MARCGWHHAEAVTPDIETSDRLPAHEGEQLALVHRDPGFVERQGLGGDQGHAVTGLGVLGKVHLHVLILQAGVAKGVLAGCAG